MPHPNEPPLHLNDLGQVIRPTGERPIWMKGGTEGVFLEDMHRRHIINAMQRVRNSDDPESLFWLVCMRHVYYQKTDERKKETD
jgi:hypothetical protein